MEKNRTGALSLAPVGAFLHGPTTALAGAYGQKIGSTQQQGAAYIQDVSTSTAM
jgi:hypothetical protein